MRFTVQRPRHGDDASRSSSAVQMDTWADGVPSCHRGSLALRRTSSLAGPTDNLLARSAHVDEERRRLTGAGREVDHHRREDDDDGLSENVPVLNGTEQGKEREKEEREGESGKEEKREETEKREENGEEKEEGDGAVSYTHLTLPTKRIV